MKKWYKSKTMWTNAIGIVAIVAQAQFGFIINVETQAAALLVINMFLRAITGERLEG